MSRLPLSLILGVALLAACRTETAPPKPRASGPAVRPKASPSPMASPSADAKGTPAPVPLPEAPVPLPKAPGPFVTLSGGVALEARYLVDQGLAQVVGEGVALTGAGSLLSDLGGGILAAQNPGLITDNGAGLLSDAGAALITDNGAGIVSNNAGGLITDNGAGIVSNHSGGYRLHGLAAAPRFALAQAAIPPGELRSVAGAVVFPIDLRTGRPVGTVLRTDAAGGFAVEVPAALAGNVLFAVRVPAPDRASPAFTDARLRPNLIAGVAAGAPRVADEDRAAVTRYLQACFVTRLEAALGEGGADAVAERLAGARLIVPELKAILLDLVAELRDAAKASGADRAPAARRSALARLMAHRLIARMDLAAIMIDPTYAPKYPGPAEPAHAAMVDVMRQMREAASIKLAADPKHFDGKPYIQGTGAQIRRGADLPAFCVEAYLIPDDTEGLEKNGVVLADLGFPIETGGADAKARLAAAMYSMVGALAQTLILDADAKADAFGVVEDYKP